MLINFIVFFDLLVSLQQRNEKVHQWKFFKWGGGREGEGEGWWMGPLYTFCDNYGNNHNNIMINIMMITVVTVILMIIIMIMLMIVVVMIMMIRQWMLIYIYMDGFSILFYDIELSSDVFWMPLSSSNLFAMLIENAHRS